LILKRHSIQSLIQSYYVDTEKAQHPIPIINHRLITFLVIAIRAGIVSNFQSASP